MGGKGRQSTCVKSPRRACCDSILESTLVTLTYVKIQIGHLLLRPSRAT
jgi:hypothetical protein